MAPLERAPVRLATMSEVLAVSRGDSAARTVGLTLNRIYFLNLKAVRQRLGYTRWLAKGAVVHAVVRSCIHRHTHHEDVCVQVGEDQYTLIFASDDIETIAMRCKLIVEAIEEKLFGRKDAGHVTVRDAASFFAENAVHRPVDTGIAEAVVDEHALLDAADEPAGAPAPVDPLFSEIHRQARRSALFKMLGGDQVDALTFAYQPVWHAREGRIAAYVCRPRRGTGPDATTGYDVLGSARDHAGIARLDIYGIEECLFTLKKLNDSGARANLTAPVHFETLAGRTTRMQLQDFLAQVPRRFGRQLTLHVEAMPLGIPESRLSEITARLRGAVGNLAVSVPMSEFPTVQALGMRSWQFGRAGIGIISIDFERQISDGMLERASRVAQALAPRGLQLAAMNVPTAEAVLELSRRNFTYLGGPPVGDLQPAPEGPRAFARHELDFQ